MAKSSGGFRLDFTKLAAEVGKFLEMKSPTAAMKPGKLYFYTAIFQVDEPPSPDLGDISFIMKSIYARQYFIKEAEAGGFDCSGVNWVPLRKHIAEKLRDHQYQEKMVDTSVVARLVEQAIRHPRRMHVLITGDRDMLPALRTVCPKYTKSIALATTHPDQYDRFNSQSSFALSAFDFVSEPMYLERHVEQLVAGEDVYTCANCRKVFVATSKLGIRENPVCDQCKSQRSSSRLRSGEN